MRQLDRVRTKAEELTTALLEEAGGDPLRAFGLLYLLQHPNASRQVDEAAHAATKARRVPPRPGDNP